MKRFLASVTIVLAALSTAGAQDACHPGGTHDLAGVIGSTIGALVGSTIGGGRGQPLATGAGALLGGLIGESLSPRRPTASPDHALVRQLSQHRERMIEAAVNGRIPMPRKAAPVRHPRQPAPSAIRRLSHCQEIEPGTLACQDAAGTWRIVR